MGRRNNCKLAVSEIARHISHQSTFRSAFIIDPPTISLLIKLE